MCPSHEKHASGYARCVFPSCPQTSIAKDPETEGYPAHAIVSE